MPLTIDYVTYPYDHEPVEALHHVVNDIKPLLDTYDLDTIQASGGDVHEIPGIIEDLDLYLFLPIPVTIWKNTIRCRMSRLAYARYCQVRAERSAEEDAEASRAALETLTHEAYLRLLDQESILNLRKRTLSELSADSKR